MEINDIYSFKYFIDYVIKRLSGKADAHTKSAIEYPLPMNFKIFNNDVFVNYPNVLKGDLLTIVKSFL